MRLLACTHCAHRVFFENTSCTYCGSLLGFVPGEGMVAFGTDDTQGWIRLQGSGPAQRPCRNYVVEHCCNWMVDAEDPSDLCRSCRLTRALPALDSDAARWRWAALESAKRRLLHPLIDAGLPVAGKTEDPAHGLAFDFVQGDQDAAPAAITGHAAGVVTLNFDEADPAVRERTREAMREPYRTLLGHFRHEAGHYYWFRLIEGSPWHEPFRTVFGDEQQDYAAALAQHYRQACSDWGDRYVSAYASAHPWEDWAETWAHYWHIVDGLETAAAWGLTLAAPAPDAAAVTPTALTEASDLAAVVVEQWLPVSRLVNAMNRSLGTPDSYPFVLSAPVLDKLAFVHRVVRSRPDDRA